MKTRLFILLLLICSCSNKSEITMYLKLQLKYKLLSGNAEFVIKDQQSVITEGLVSLFDSPEPTFRKATTEDELKAIELSFKMTTLKNFMDDAASNCEEIQKVLKSMNIFNSGKKKSEVDYLKETLKIHEDSMLEVTDGIPSKEFINPYIPKSLRESTDFFE